MKRRGSRVVQGQDQQKQEKGENGARTMPNLGSWFFGFVTAGRPFTHAFQKHVHFFSLVSYFFSFFKQ
jgi:hypothetical protein